MAVTAEPIKEPIHLGVQQSVLGDLAGELAEFALRRQLAIQQEVSDFEEAGLVCQLIDRVAAMEQNAFLSINERNLALA